MRGLFILFFLMALSFTGYGVHAESSWDKLIGEIDQKQPKGSKDAKLLEMPDMSEQTQSQAQQQGDGDVKIKSVPNYQCANPRFPTCLRDMRRYPNITETQNCRELTKLYLQATAAYNRCVNRQTRKHARKVVDTFNCLAQKRKGCPYAF